ncbi:MAG: thiamine-phosphate kinase, partial [Gammaproteobacteria bacterium]
NNLCYSVDQNYEGIHFPKSLPPEFIATRSVLRSFSDISAMGARPLWFSVALACDFDEKFINDFSRGLNKVSNSLRVPLIGGDLVKTSQKSVTVSVSGETKKNSHLSRSGAKHNQNIYLTGELGLARKGLEEIKENCNKNIYSKKNVKRFIFPKLRLEISNSISQFASSCIDVSDGFIADLEKILIPSNQGAVINLNRIPRIDKSSLEDFTFGDDLELIFSADKKYHKKIMKLSDNSGINISLLGQTKKDSGIKYLLNNDEVLFPREKGWNHGKK